MKIKDLFNFGLKRKQMSIIQSWGLGGTVGFPDSKEKYVTDGYEGSATVYSVVKIISDTFASAPGVMYKVKNQKSFEQYKLLSKQYNGSSSMQLYKAKSAAFDEVESHPLLEMLRKPNTIYGGFDFLVHANASRDITGDCFIWVNRGLTGGDPISLKILPAQFMMLKVSSPFDVEGYTLQLGRPTDFTAEEVLHWKHPNLNFDPYGLHLFGLSPLKAASKDYTLSANKEGKKAAAQAFKNQGAGGLLARNEDIPWEKPQRDDLNAYIDEVINGNDNKGKVRAVNAKFSWIQMAMSADDMKIVEALQMTKEDICNIYNFPAHIISGGRATQNNVGESNKYLVTKTVYSRWVSWRDFVNGKLLPLYKDGAQYYYDFDISSFPEVQEDQAKLVESLSKMPITSNEFRSVVGWDKSSEQNADKIMVPSNSVLLESMGNDQMGGSINSDLQDLNNEGVKDYDY